MKAKTLSGGKRRTNAVARQNQRETKLFLTLVLGCLGLYRDHSCHKQEGRNNQLSHIESL
jgi:hypothetical protein